MKVIRNIKVLLIMMVLLLPSFAKAQDISDYRDMKVKVLMPENENISEGLLSSLQDRLNEAVSLNMLGSIDENARFVLLPVVNIVSKNATASIPPQFVAEIEIALYFADNQSKTILSQVVITKKGMAESESKAVAKALKSLQARDKKIKKLFDDGKKKYAQFDSTETVSPGNGNSSDYGWILNKE